MEGVPVRRGPLPHRGVVTRVLVTGMSGTGKSTVLAELERRGVRVVDTDDDGWSHEVPEIGGPGVMQLWREGPVSRLLDEAGTRPLVVAGAASNQGRFYDRFDAVVLLSAPTSVLLERLRDRDGNPFGKDPDDVRRILRDIEEAQPLLQATSTVELDATRPIADLADEIESLLVRAWPATTEALSADSPKPSSQAAPNPAPMWSMDRDQEPPLPAGAVRSGVGDDDTAAR